MACHDIEDDAHAPDIRHLWDVWLAHQYLRCSICVTTAVCFTAYEMSIFGDHASTCKAKVYQLDVPVLYTR